MKGKRCGRILEWLFFILYIAALLYFVFFAESLGRVQTEQYRYNLVPFKEINRFLQNWTYVGRKSVIFNIVGNVAAFVPLGMAIPMIGKGKPGFVTVVLYTVCLSISIELIQLVTKVGSCDVDDVMLNTIGGMLGWLIYRVLSGARTTDGV